MSRINGLPALFAAAVIASGAGCSASTAEPAEPPSPQSTVADAPVPPAPPEPASPEPPAPTGAQPALAADPARLADDLVADEHALRSPSTPEPELVAAARRQQGAYRAIGYHPEWDSIVHPRIPAELVDTYDRNIDARRQLTALTPPRDTLPAWRIQPPPPLDELMGYYRETEAATGVGWNYLAAINLIETRFGSIVGDSTAGAQGPMQFMPSTFAAYGQGDIHAPRDAILSAGRYLAANGFAGNPDRAIFAYNRADEYVRAVNQYAAIMAADPAAIGGYHRWDVYYRTTLGDVLLPIGYQATERIPAAQYLATHPQ